MGQKGIDSCVYGFGTGCEHRGCSRKATSAESPRRRDLTSMGLSVSALPPSGHFVGHFKGITPPDLHSIMPILQMRKLKLRDAK